MTTKSGDKTIYVCSSCGRSYSRWMGRCPECNEWNSIIEEKITVSRKGERKAVSDINAEPISACFSNDQYLIETGMDEFDHMLGGGIVADSSILLGGEPGIGKSTLMLQIAGKLAELNLVTLYLTGEESAQQVALRGRRIGVTGDLVQIAAVRELPQIYAILEKGHLFAVIVDSVQTLFDPNLESLPGTVSQIKSAAAELIDYCKRSGMVLILVGHITKDGAIAGPKLLEHLVDVVLYFEGDTNNWYRLLRVKKNRFGPASEVGIFRIGEKGLITVPNPSELFLDQHDSDVSGRAVVTAIEGERPLLLEMQALATQTNFGFPQRVTSGYDSRRLALMLAILEKRMKIPFGQRDVFVNLAGGLRIEDPALDLGLLAAIISSVEDIAILAKTVIIGEVGLTGEVRAVSSIERRLNESAKLGFERIILPARNLDSVKQPKGVKLIGIDKIQDLATSVLG